MRTKSGGGFSDGRTAGFRKSASAGVYFKGPDVLQSACYFIATTARNSTAPAGTPLQLYYRASVAQLVENRGNMCSSTYGVNLPRIYNTDESIYLQRINKKNPYKPWIYLFCQ